MHGRVSTNEVAIYEVCPRKSKASTISGQRREIKFRHKEDASWLDERQQDH